MKSFLHALALMLPIPAVAAMTLVLASASVAQDGTGERAVIEIVQIMHRDPGRIRDTIRSALDSRGSIGQIDDKLIIATTATNFQQLQALIADTDVPPRRLVVGVDFAYQPDAADTSAQQQSQAIEGQELVFIARAIEADNDIVATDSADNELATDVSDTPRITIAAEIVGNGAAVNLSLDNIPGLSGDHIARLPLGVWQLINTPVTDTDTDTDTDVDAEAQPDLRVIAVRVDRVP